MAIGTLHGFVLDVNDLAEAERFWSAVTGLEPQGSWEGRYTRLGRRGDPGATLLLQHVSEDKAPAKNRAHLDVAVADIDEATERVVALGGRSIRDRVAFPETSQPFAEWAVVSDPFGNEFCLVREV